MVAMKIITIALPTQFIECIEALTALNIIPSRSEFVRDAIKEFLPAEIKIMENVLTQETFTRIGKIIDPVFYFPTEEKKQ